MNRLHIATRCPCDWRSRLGDPEKHWKRHASAMETAVSWECADHTSSGLPQPIADVFQASDLKEANLLLAVAEHKVHLDGKGADGQCDVWALVASNAGMASVSVEAKAKEPFGKNNESLRDWLKGGKSPDSPSNREIRRKHVAANLPACCYDDVPFQILQRAACAVIEARRFRLNQAVFLVQSFGSPQESFDMYALFSTALGLGLPVRNNHLVFSSVKVEEIRLGIGWVDCPFATDSQVAAALANERVLPLSNDLE